MRAIALLIIFLDVDGVLNSRRFIMGESGLRDHADMIDPKAVARLNEIVRRTGAKIVVSSSWRHGYSIQGLVDLFAKHGLVAEIIGATPNSGPERGDEIAAWLRANRKPVRSFVILDDDADMGALMPRLVKTKFAEGLLDEHVEQAVALLTEGA